MSIENRNIKCLNMTWIYARNLWFDSASAQLIACPHAVFIAQSLSRWALPFRIKVMQNRSIRLQILAPHKQNVHWESKHKRFKYDLDMCQNTSVLQCICSVYCVTPRSVPSGCHKRQRKMLNSKFKGLKVLGHFRFLCSFFSVRFLVPFLFKVLRTLS